MEILVLSQGLQFYTKKKKKKTEQKVDGGMGWASARQRTYFSQETADREFGLNRIFNLALKLALAYEMKGILMFQNHCLKFC